MGVLSGDVFIVALDAVVELNERTRSFCVHPNQPRHPASPVRPAGWHQYRELFYRAETVDEVSRSDSGVRRVERRYFWRLHVDTIGDGELTFALPDGFVPPVELIRNAS